MHPGVTSKVRPLIKKLSLFCPSEACQLLKYNEYINTLCMGKVARYKEKNILAQKVLSLSQSLQQKFRGDCPCLILVNTCRSNNYWI